MTAFVVDANVMNCFQLERIAGSDGLACSALNMIVSVGYIVLDESGLCEAEWIACAGGKPPLALQDWIADMFVAHRIRLIRLQNENLYTELKKLGVPKSDHKWVRLAISAESGIIVTEDIDLFDPTKKMNCSSATKSRIKRDRTGPVSKYLRKKYAIEVICLQHVDDFAKAA